MSLLRSPDSGLTVVLLFFVAVAIATLSVDPVRTTQGLKSDEATYVTMALSIAHDGDLAFQQRDLTRFWPLYNSGPEGIFLKQGKGPDDRLYFGKSFIYPLIAAPFVKVAGLNGLLLLNVVLLAGVFTCFYLYAHALMPAPAALAVSTGFLGASIAPLFGVWMMPETFNLACVGYAYFFWLYKEVRPRVSPRWARSLVAGPGSDIAAAILLGMATFSKPSHALLILPPVALMLWRRDVGHGLRVGLVFGLVTVAGFGTNALITGELNYQGGDRKTFYGEFPFQTSDSTYDTLGIPITTNTLEFEGWRHLARNTGYFFVGRHFGLVPYYFPAIVIIVWALFRRRDLSLRHGFTAMAIAGTALILMILYPNTWSGGGGPPANRYFLGIYPAFYFLLPTARTILPGVAMWVGGALFVAPILLDPFVAARRPWQNSQQGLLRALPVELTVVNDLPVQLDRGRSRVPYGSDPQLLLYYLDENAWRPEAAGIWIKGSARADIIVRTEPAIGPIDITLRSPIQNRVRVTVDGVAQDIELTAHASVVVQADVTGVYARGAQTFVLSVETEAGFIPHLVDATSTDQRFLGVLVNLTPRRR